MAAAEPDLHYFFPTDDAARHAAAALPPRLLLTGPARSGKSSLLLQLAYSHAAQGGTALLVCVSRGHLESHPPVRPRGGAASGAVDDDVMRRIQIKYVSSLEQLNRLLCRFHLPSPVSSAHPAGSSSPHPHPPPPPPSAHLAVASSSPHPQPPPPPPSALPASSSSSSLAPSGAPSAGTPSPHNVHNPLPPPHPPITALLIDDLHEILGAAHPSPRKPLPGSSASHGVGHAGAAGSHSGAGCSNGYHSGHHSGTGCSSASHSGAGSGGAPRKHFPPTHNAPMLFSAVVALASHAADLLDAQLQRERELRWEGGLGQDGGLGRDGEVSREGGLKGEGAFGGERGLRRERDPGQEGAFGGEVGPGRAGDLGREGVLGLLAGVHTASSPPALPPSTLGVDACMVDAPGAAPSGAPIPVADTLMLAAPVAPPLVAAPLNAASPVSTPPGAATTHVDASPCGAFPIALLPIAPFPADAALPDAPIPVARPHVAPPPGIAHPDAPPPGIALPAPAPGIHTPVAPAPGVVAPADSPPQPAPTPRRCTLAIASLAGAAGLTDDVAKLLGRWLGGEIYLQPETDASSAVSPVHRPRHASSPMRGPTTAAQVPGRAGGGTYWSLNLHTPLAPPLTAAPGWSGPAPHPRPRWVYTLSDGEVQLVQAGVVSDAAVHFGVEPAAAIRTPSYGRHRPVPPSQLVNVPAPRW